MKKIILLFSTIFIISCCCTWQGFVTGIFNFLMITEPVPITAKEYLTSMYRVPMSVPSELKDFQGVYTESPGFTNYYLRYSATKEFALNLIASMPYKKSDQVNSDDVCHLSSSYSSVKEKFFPKSDDLSKVDFWNPGQIKDGEYYTCVKFPWEHTVLFDKTSDIVYEVINEIGE